MKFVWQSGDVKVSRTQCETCKHYSKDGCEKYKEIPEGILKSEKKCEHIKIENKPW